MAEILIIGGAHIDRKGWLAAPHRAGASNPGHWESEAGGGAFNAARNLARLGHQVTLVAPRGGDAAADLVARAAEDAGIEDCPLTFLDRATPSYAAILEPDGNLVTALADMALYDMVPARRLLSSRLRKRLTTSDMLLADSNLPESALSALADAAAAVSLPLAVIAVSPVKVLRWKPSLAKITCLAMNSAEAAALTGAQAKTSDEWVHHLAKAGLRGGLISTGPEPVTAFAASASGLGSITLQPPPLESLSDVTGAGDALASGYLDGLLAGSSIQTNLTRGIALARLTAAIRGPVRPDLSETLLAQALEAMPKPSQIQSHRQETHS